MVHVTDREDSGGRCWSCDHPVAPEDRYCGYCGQGQGAFLGWYYRPLWIVLLALTVLGPLALLLVWRTPRLDRTGKWIASLVIIGFFGYVGWQFAIGVRELERVLGAP
jgi:hypothetical protein